MLLCSFQNNYFTLIIATDKPVINRSRKCLNYAIGAGTDGLVSDGSGLALGFLAAGVAFSLTGLSSIALAL